MALKDILTVGSDGQATAGGAGLNEQPVKNYLKTYANAAAAPGTLSQLASTTANLVSLTAFYTDATSSTSALVSSSDTTLRSPFNYLSAVSGSNTNGSRFVQFPAQQLDGVDLGKPISISFDVSGVTTDGNWDAVIVRYNSSGVYQNTLSIAGNVSSASAFPSAKLPTGTTTFNGFFVPDSTTEGDLYALRLRSLANTVQIRVDTLFIGPQPVRVGAAITDLTTYTPTLTNFGNGTANFGFRREGNLIRIIGTLMVGSSLPTGQITFALPAGLTADYSSLNRGVLSTDAYQSVGIAKAYVNEHFTAQVIRNITSTTEFFFEGAGATYGSRMGWAATVGSVTLALNDTISLDMSVPITGWSSNVTMADRAVETYSADDGTNDVFGPSGTFVPNIALSTGVTNRDFIFQTPQNSTDHVFVEYEVGGGAGFSAGNPYPFIDGQSSYSFGMRGYWLNQTTFRVQFGNGGLSPKNGLGAAGVDSWASVSSSHKWRVRKVSGGAQVGYPISSANIVGRVDGVAPATGMVGEDLSVSNAADISVTSNVYNTILSRTLTGGIYLVSAKARFKILGATISSDLFAVSLGVDSTSSLNASSDDTAGASAWAEKTIVAPTIIVRCDGSNLITPHGTISGTTLNVRVYPGVFTGTMNLDYRLLTVIRIA